MQKYEYLLVAHVNYIVKSIGGEEIEGAADAVADEMEAEAEAELTLEEQLAEAERDLGGRVTRESRLADLADGGAGPVGVDRRWGPHTSRRSGRICRRTSRR